MSELIYQGKARSRKMKVTSGSNNLWMLYISHLIYSRRRDALLRLISVYRYSTERGTIKFFSPCVLVPCQVYLLTVLYFTRFITLFQCLFFFLGLTFTANRNLQTMLYVGGVSLDHTGTQLVGCLTVDTACHWILLERTPW